jgi:hypothetical protein
VNRSDGAVDLVVVGGRAAFRRGEFDAAFGRDLGFGQFLPAGEKVGAPLRAKPAARVEAAA